MLKNKKFARYAIAFMILGILFNFMYSGLQNDQINIIQASSAWSATATQMPMTVGNFVCIVLTFVYGTLFIKFGVKKTLIPCIAVCALGCIGIAVANGVTVTGTDGVVATYQIVSANANNAGVDVSTMYTAINGNYALYAVSLFLVRCGCMCFQMSGFQLAASWFIRYRGSVLGFVTLGSPLFSVVGTSVMTGLISSAWEGDYRPFYVGVAVVLVIIAILVGLLLKDMPEDAGLYPDGSDTPPKSEANTEDEVHLTVAQVLKMPKSWILIVNFGVFQYVINACMASMVTWFMYLCNANWDIVSSVNADNPTFAATGAMFLFVGQASRWLAVGAILGIPVSFLFGVIDDRFGTPVATLILGISEILPVVGLMSQASAVANTGSCSVPMLIVWGFGVACMTGGVPTMHPASMSYVFGRREYQSANRIIMAIQLIPSAVAASITMAMINSGNGVLAWTILIVAIVVGLIFTIPMFKMKDANAEDRIYGSK